MVVVKTRCPWSHLYGEHEIELEEPIQKGQIDTCEICLHDSEVAAAGLTIELVRREHPGS